MSVAAALPLSAKQVRSIAEATAPICVWDGAIRSGKTISSLIKWLGYVADPPEGGELLMFGKTTHSLFRNVFTPLMNPAIFGPVARHVHYSPGQPTANILGRTVHVIGANDSRAEEKVRGFTCAGAYGDELSLAPYGFYEQVIGRMSVEDAQLFATTNPDNPVHWLKRDVLNGENPDVRSWHFVMDDNPSLTEEKKAFYRRQHTGVFFKRNILGLWVAAEGAVFDMFDEEKHVVDIVPTIVEWVCVSVDYGTQNPFHALLIGIGIDGCMYVVSEWRWDGRAKRRQLTDPEYVEALKAWLKSPGGGLKDVEVPYVVIDPSATSFRAMVHREGIRQAAADNAVTDGIRLVSGLFAEDRLKIARRCKYLTEELYGYCWDDKAALLGEDKPLKVADHGVDSLRYGTKTTESRWRRHLAAA